MTTNQIVPFNFENLSIRAIVNERGEPWFIGKDVAGALGYTNPQKAVRDHCKAPMAIGVNESFTPSQDLLSFVHQFAIDPQTVIISESDMFRLIVNSKLPSAERFERWVFEEVLPSIRKTGSYAAKPVPPQQRARLPQSQPVRDLLLIGKAMSKVKGVNEALAMACTLDAIERTTGLPTMLLTKALPSVAPEDTASLNATQIGEPLGLNGRTTNALLEKLGLQYRDENKNWKLTEAGTAYGEMKPFHRNGHSGYETRWKLSVADVVRKHLDSMEKAA